MHMLLPGYPRANPILRGVVSLLSGIPLEEVIEEREKALPTPLDFAHACLEAVRWLPPESPLAKGLVSQSLQAFLQLEPTEQARLMAQAEGAAREAGGHLVALVSQWQGAMSE